MSVVDPYKDFRFLVNAGADFLEIPPSECVVVSCDSPFLTDVIDHARKIVFRPNNDILINFFSYGGKNNSNVEHGLIKYQYKDITFVLNKGHLDHNLNNSLTNVVIVPKKYYRKLFRYCYEFRKKGFTSVEPILSSKQRNIIWDNTIGYLQNENLKKLKEYGCRPKRGLIFTGSPGQGKTLTCRWLLNECFKRGWEARTVSHDDYHAARSRNNLKQLFSVRQRGMVFFDDMDVALRDRKEHETEDQNIFLSALDGISVNEGVVYVFTTNCSIDLIDDAFKRPGRIDVIVDFKAPSPVLQKKLISRWHKDIVSSLDDEFYENINNYSFAELDEIRNLMALYFLQKNVWDWRLALKQFAVNRAEFNESLRHSFGGLVQKTKTQELLDDIFDDDFTE